MIRLDFWFKSLKHGAMLSSALPLVKVLCESCLVIPASDCIVCQGRLFYLWNPETWLCYLADGSPLLAESNGRLLPVSRSPHTRLPDENHSK
jgi:hypothetical protein